MKKKKKKMQYWMQIYVGVALKDCQYLLDQFQKPWKVWIIYTEKLNFSHMEIYSAWKEGWRGGWWPSVAVCLCAGNLCSLMLYLCHLPLSSTVTFKADLHQEPERGPTACCWLMLGAGLTTTLWATMSFDITHAKSIYFEVFSKNLTLSSDY